MNKTKIEWADFTWNPVTGCDPISEACRHCYAHSIANRFWGKRKFSDIRFHKDRLSQPCKLNKGESVFVGSMTDMFHERVKDSWLDQVMAVVDDCPHHNFMFLTKRPNRARDYFYKRPPNRMIWLGVTAENQARWDERVPVLMGIRGLIRKFVSVEPMLGPVGFYATQAEWVICGRETGTGARRMNPEWATQLYERCKENKVAFFYKNNEIPGLPKEFPTP